MPGWSLATQTPLRAGALRAVAAANADGQENPTPSTLFRGHITIWKGTNHFSYGGAHCIIHRRQDVSFHQQALSQMPCASYSLLALLLFWSLVHKCCVPRHVEFWSAVSDLYPPNFLFSSFLLLFIMGWKQPPPQLFLPRRQVGWCFCV